MKRIILILALLFLAAAPAHNASAQTNIRVFDTVLFFDGYAATVTMPAPQPGITRHRNDLYARKMTTAELSSIGSTLDMMVTIKARCDNYDRIGNVNMALVPKGATTYKPDSVARIELGRFITPFMNKNIQPDTVPYRWNIDNVAALLKETSITASFDIWIELEVFGVPYAAQTQVSGCSGRTDVFYGSLKFITNSAAPTQSNNVLIPLNFKKNLNNYEAAATDTLGKTTRTITFNVPHNLTSAALYLVTSNHGANNGGEEYNRRNHYAYFDGQQVRTYKPGSATCEPYRVYNTQGNGIYGASPRTPTQWQSFSNWCPGDTIPIRRIDLGAVSTGTHSFMLRVPDAQFVNGEGYFPISLYLQGKTNGVTGIEIVGSTDVSLYPNPSDGQVSVEMNNSDRIAAIHVLNAFGATVYLRDGLRGKREVIDLRHLASGLYTVRVKTASGTQTVQKLQLIK